jgi:hypothetical protein
MQLRVARLCLDCEEIHEAQVCPVCASESFAFISRWIAVPERRLQPRPATPRDPNVGNGGKAASKSVTATVARGAAGLAALTFAGWLWQRVKTPGSPDTQDESGAPET